MPSVKTALMIKMMSQLMPNDSCSLSAISGRHFWLRAGRAYRHIASLHIYFASRHEHLVDFLDIDARCYLMKIITRQELIYFMSIIIMTIALLLPRTILL